MKFSEWLVMGAIVILCVILLASCSEPQPKTECDFASEHRPQWSKPLDEGVLMDCEAAVGNVMKCYVHKEKANG
jgi:hypothetical protein